MKLSLYSPLRKAAYFAFFALAMRGATVTVQPPSALAAHPGTTVTQDLKVDVQPGFHVNSDKPKDEFIIPLKLTWLSGPLTIRSVSYPKPEEIKVGSETLTVFTGNFSIQSQFTVPQQAPPGTSTMVGKLRYQACNNQMCLRPQTVDVRVPVTVQ